MKQKLKLGVLFVLSLTGLLCLAVLLDTDTPYIGSKIFLVGITTFTAVLLIGLENTRETLKPELEEPFSGIEHDR